MSEAINMATLPTAVELAALPLRSITAYAVRSARRATAVLRGVMDENVIEEPLRLAEKFASNLEVDRADTPAAALSAGAVARAMNNLEVRHQTLAALTLTCTAMTIVGGLQALTSSANLDGAKHHAVFAAKQAAQCANSAAKALGDKVPSAEAIRASRADYETLVAKFGKDRGIVLGEPIDFAAEWWPNAA
jgi:hypothetical protein